MSERVSGPDTATEPAAPDGAEPAGPDGADPAGPDGAGATLRPAAPARARAAGEADRPAAPPGGEGTAPPGGEGTAPPAGDGQPEPSGAGALDPAVTGVEALTETEQWEHFAPAPERAPGRGRRTAGRLGGVLLHEWTLVSLAGLVLAAVMTWPTLLHPASTIPADIWDPTLQAWQMAWSGHALLTDPAHLWDSNTFFPEPTSFAFSDTLLGYAPAGMIGTGPTAALVRYNIMFVLLFALAFVGTYVLVRQLGSGRTGAVVAGVAVAFAPWRWGQAGHMHVLSVGGIMLALAMLARGHGYSLTRGYRAERVRPGWALAGWLVAAWQVSLGFGVGLPFAYVLCGLAVVVAGRWLLPPLVRRLAGRLGPARRLRVPGRLLLMDGIGGLVFAAIGALLAVPYFQVVARHPYAKRGMDQVALYSPPLRGFFTGARESLLWGGLHDGARSTMVAANEMAILPGFALYALALVGLFLSTWRLRTRLWLLGGVLASVVLAMGTQFFGGRLTYEPLYRYLPGFDSLRTPGRLVLWTSLLLAVLAAGAVDAMTRRAHELARLRYPFRPGTLLRLATLVPVLLVLAEGVPDLAHPVVPRQPAAMRDLRGPALVLPSDQLTDENVMLWTTTGFPRVVNGGSGFTPAGQADTRRRAETFPDPQSVSDLRNLGVRTVVVLRDRVVGTPYEHALTDPVDGLGITRRERGDTVVFDLGQG
jgi:hypothetical protein